MEGTAIGRTFAQQSSAEAARTRGGGPRRKQVKYAPDVPRVIETTRRRAALKDALNEPRDERMMPDGVSLERWERRQEDGAMKANRPKSSPFSEHVAKVIQDNVTSESGSSLARRKARKAPQIPSYRRREEGRQLSLMRLKAESETPSQRNRRRSSKRRDNYTRPAADPS